jgi:hypothetical protein
VLPRDIAKKLVDGTRLSKEDMAFVTAAEDLKGIDSRAAMAKRLSLFENPEATKLRALDDHVVVEFKSDLRTIRSSRHRSGIPVHGEMDGFLADLRGETQESGSSIRRRFQTD